MAEKKKTIEKSYALFKKKIIIFLENPEEPFSSVNPSRLSYLNNLEEKILRARKPIKLADTEDIEINASTQGSWLNKQQIRLE